MDSIIGFRECRFSFDDGRAFDGFTDGSRWNGFLNVWVRPEVHQEVRAHVRTLAGDEAEADEFEASFAELTPTDDSGPYPAGLYSYAYGFATVEVEEKADPKPVRACDEVYVEQYLLQSCGWVKIHEYTCDSRADAGSVITDILTRYPNDRVRFEVRGPKREGVQ